MDDLEFRCYFAIGLWLIFTSPNKPQNTVSISTIHWCSQKSSINFPKPHPPALYVGRTSSANPRLLPGVSRLLPRRYPSPNPKLFHQPGADGLLESNPSPLGWSSFLGYLLGWTNVYKRLHKLTALVFLGIHLSFACRFVVVLLG